MGAGAPIRLRKYLAHKPADPVPWDRAAEILKAGDVVRLKSVRPAMTILKIIGDGFEERAWFDGNSLVTKQLLGTHEPRARRRVNRA
jgi:uncharacterized protein YodC (DUF2158 family)